MEMWERRENEQIISFVMLPSQAVCVSVCAGINGDNNKKLFFILSFNITLRRD